MTNQKISLVIPAHNEEKYIAACLHSVLENAPGKFFEIIVVDNASTDATARVAGSIPGVRVVSEPKKGLTRARECGYHTSSGDLIAYIDADTRLPKSWITTVEKVFSQNEHIVCLSGPYRYYDGSKIKNAFLIALWWLTAPITYRLVGYMVLGGNFILRRSALSAMGGFDTNIDFYGEDTDIARRLSKYGKVVFRMDFFIYSSARRFADEGLFKTNITYALNFIWEVVFHRPFSKSYKDIRT